VTALRASAVLVTVLAAAALAGPSPALGATGPQGSYATACRAAGSVVAATRGVPAVVPVAAHAALPPTPLPDVLAATRTAVVARVAAVLYQGRPPKTPRRPPGFVGPIPPKRCQVIRLVITQVLRGRPPNVLVAVKPLAPYLLTASRRPHAGTFLLDGGQPFPTILGNDGPDPYPPTEVAAAIGAGG
jgi:hypothetical protein